MADKATCECFVVPEEQWTRHYDATEPGSMVEPNPDCPVHFATGKPVPEGRMERIEALCTEWERNPGRRLDYDEAATCVREALGLPRHAP